MPGPTIGDAVIRIGADATNFATGLAKQTEQTGLTVGSKLASFLGGAFKIGIGVVGSAVSGVLGTALVKGFSRLNAIEEAKAKLLGLGNSASQVQKIMDNALTSVLGTAFGMGDAASQAAVLVAAGIKPGKELTATLKLVGDTATIAGTGLSEMGNVFSTIAATGRLTGYTMNELQVRGIPVLTKLAEHYGITTAAAQEMVTRGKVSFADFEKVMQTSLGGAALASGKTFSGAMNNAGAALSRFGAGLLGGVFDQLPGMIATAIKWIDTITPAAKRIGNSIGAFLTTSIKGIKSWADSPAVKSFMSVLVTNAAKFGDYLLNVAIPALKTGLDAVVKWATSPGVVDFMKTMLNALWDFGAFIGKTVIPKLAEFLSNVITFMQKPEVASFAKSMLTGATNIANFIKDTVIPGLNDLTTAIAGIATFFADHEKAAKALQLVIEGVAALIVAAWIRQGIAAGVSSLQSVAAWFAQTGAAAAGGVQSDLTTAQIVVGWMRQAAAAVASGAETAGIWIMLRVEALSSAIAAQGGFLMMIGGWVATAAAAVAHGVAVAAEWVADGARWIAGAAVAAANAALIALTWIGATAAAGAHGVAVGAMWVAQAVVAALNMGLVIASVVGGWIAIAAGALLGAAQVAIAWVIAFWPIALVIAAVVALGIIIWKNFDNIKGWIGTAWTWVKEKTMSVWNAITGFFTTTWTTIKLTITLAILRVQSIVEGAWRTIRGGASTAWNAVVSTITTAWSNLKTGIVNKAGEVIAFVTGIPGKITSAISGAGTMLLQTGRDILQGLWDGMTEIWNKFTGWVGGLADKIKSLKGPIEVDRQLLVPAGKAIMDGFQESMQIGQDKVLTGMKAFTQDLKSSATQWAPALQEAMGKPMSFTGAIGTGPSLGAIASAGTSTIAGVTLLGRPTSSTNGFGRTGPATTTSGDSYSIAVTVSVDDIARMGTVADFVDMLQGSKTAARKVARSGKTTD